MSSLIDWLRLALTPEVGPVTAHRWLQRWGSPGVIFDAARDDAAEFSRLSASALATGLARAEEAIERAAKCETRIIPLDHPEYPKFLKLLKNPPLVLYVRGALLPVDALALAVVGPRKPSDYGRAMAKTLIPALCARSITIVSGMAYGIDAEAHLAAVECGGRTVGVIAQGLDTPLFPASNRMLANRVVEKGLGAIISAFPFGTTPEPYLFPQRNEIIAGMTLGTLVIEAGEKSGSLITAGCAAELGRPVMACPGDATRTSSRGSNRLIADGAALIQNSDDVLSAMEQELRRARDEMDRGDAAEEISQMEIGMGETDAGEEAASNRKTKGSRKPEKREAPVLSKPQDALSVLIAELLSNDHRTIDYLLEACAQAGHTQSEVIQKLLTLELNGHISQLPGRVYRWAS